MCQHDGNSAHSSRGDRRARGPQLIIVTGPSGCGKTTVCQRVAERARARGLDVAGLLTLPRLDQGQLVGRDVVDLRSGTRRALAERAGRASGPLIGRWQFHAEVLAWGAQMLDSATPCEILVIDELGPLELIRGQGWANATTVLKGGRYDLGLLVLRPSLLDHIGWPPGAGGPTVTTLTVTPEGRDALPDEVVRRYLGGL